MGKGTIISGGASGLYQVQINYDRVLYNSQISLLNSQILLYAAKLIDLDSRIASKEAEIAVESDLDRLTQLNLELFALQQNRSITSLRKMSFEKRKAFLTANMPTDETVSAWCADYSENLSGVVGTIETPGYETGDNINIKPGFTSAAWSESDDKQLLPEISMSAHQSYFNRAVLPAVEKWKPRYRYGILTSINYGNDTADVTLESATSSQQDLDINQSATLSSVPIDYMDCNSAAFQVGSEVLIMFNNQDWSDPVIIGFKSSPAPCECKYITITTGNYDVSNTIASYSDGTWDYFYPVPMGTGEGPTIYNVIVPDDPPLVSNQDSFGGTDITIQIDDIPGEPEGATVDKQVSWTKNGQTTIATADFDFTEDYDIDYEFIGGYNRAVIPIDKIFARNTGTWNNSNIETFTAVSLPSLPGGAVEIGTNFNFTRYALQFWNLNLSIKSLVLPTISTAYKYLLFEVSKLTKPPGKNLEFIVEVTNPSWLYNISSISATGKYYIELKSGSTAYDNILWAFQNYSVSAEILNTTYNFEIKNIQFCIVLPGAGESDISNWY